MATEPAAEQGITDRALELLVYAPIGLLVYLRDTSPSFVRLFVARGRDEVEQRRQSVGDQPPVSPGGAEAPPSPAPPQLRQLVSDGLAFVRTCTGRSDERPRAGYPGEQRGATGERSDERPRAGYPGEQRGATGERSDERPRAGYPGEQRGATGERSDERPRAGTSELERLAIPDYDELAAAQVVDLLEGLPIRDLEAIRDYERRHRGRRTVLGKIEQLLASGS